VSSVYALWTSELTFSANHTAVDDWFERLRVAAFAKQHDFSQIIVGKLSCRAGGSARPARDASGGTGLLFDQLFV